MIKIENMTLTDLYSIQDTLVSDFDDFWNYSVLKSELESPNSHYIVAKDNSKIFGFAGIKVSVVDADIMNIVVRKDLRNSGLGSLLLEGLINLAKSLNVEKLFLEVNEKNLPAISLYKKFDFKEISKRKKYYKENDAIVMYKEI